MSARYLLNGQIRITCDTCPACYTARPSDAYTIDGARQVASTVDGWHCDSSSDQCPKCYKLAQCTHEADYRYIIVWDGAKTHATCRYCGKRFTTATASVASRIAQEVTQ